LAKQLVVPAPVEVRVGGAAFDDAVGRPTSYGAVKPVIELCIAALLLLASLPFMGMIALAIRLDTPGPVFFKQERIGRGGRPFTIYKFRSMVAGAPAYSFKVACSDPRVTRVGRWLRLVGLDELPQLINVVRGEMSLIGPRPEMAFIVKEYDPWQEQRLTVKPGITGWWQIHHRNEVPMHLNLEYDIYYLQHFSFWLDARIVGSTILLMLGTLFRSVGPGGG
jgi:lipopolysaccharide/colanic/teichoic acid biosynthesis glycosyltransferase